MTYELTSELGDGDVVALHFLDVVCASAAGTALETVGVDGSISLEEDGMTGDVNGDGSVNVIDIVALVNIILNDLDPQGADYNGDGTVNVIDVVALVHFVLNN